MSTSRIETRLERSGTTTLLGIRFWDPASDVQITDALVVTARSAVAGGSRRHAFSTASGIYAFQGLSGMREAENGTLLESFAAATRDFIIEVDDVRRRFIRMSFKVALPLRRSGLYMPPTVPPGIEPRGFFLFSAPTRTGTPGMAAIRASLVDDATGEPVAHALVEVVVAGEHWYGISNERGDVLVVMPYPTFTGAVGTSPPGPRPDRQDWPVTVRVFHRTSTLSFMDESVVPELSSIFRQPAADIVDGNGDVVPSLRSQLVFGRELVMRTNPGSALRIRPD